MVPEEFVVGLVQMACTDHPARNHQVAEDGIRAAAKDGAQIVCLQELFVSQYFCQSEDSRHFDLAEEIPGPSTKRYGRLAQELGLVIVVPLFERRAPGLYHNSAAVIESTGELLGIYRKLHIPDDPQYYEKFYFAPGDKGYGVFTTSVATVGVLICWDQWYPEAARLTALQGAEIIFYPSAIGWLKDEHETEGRVQCQGWKTVHRAHAIENGVYVAAVNRIGQEGEPGLDFWGQSFVCDPRGIVVAEASPSHAEIIVSKCSRGLIERQRRDWPFLRDRRIDTYGALSQRFIDIPRSKEKLKE